MGKRQTTREHHTQEGQEVSPIPAGDHKAARNRQDSMPPFPVFDGCFFLNIFGRESSKDHLCQIIFKSGQKVLIKNVFRLFLGLPWQPEICMKSKSLSKDL